MNFLKRKDKNFIDLLKGGSTSLFIKVSGMALSYVSMLFITNYYGVNEWGIYSLCLTILNIVVLLPIFGFDNSLVRIITELKSNMDKKEILNVLYKSLKISLIISLVVIVVINTCSDIFLTYVFKDENLMHYLTLISIAILPMVVLTITTTVFQALQKTTLFMLFKTTLINLFFLVLLVLYKWLNPNVSVFEIYLYTIIIVLIVSIVFLRSNLKKLSEAISNVKIGYGYRKIITISSPMLFSNSISLLISSTEIMMLSYYATTQDIGIYSSVLKLASLSVIPLFAINAITTPKFVEFYTKNDIQGLKDVVQKSTKIIFFLSAPILSILIFFPKTILGFFGDEFVFGYSALMYLCVSRFFYAISGSVGYIMQMTDNQKTYQNIILIAFLLNMGLNFILIPKYGFNGAAITNTISTIFWNFALILIIKKKFGFWTFYIPGLSKR